MGYDHAEEKEITPVAGSSSSSNNADLRSETLPDSETKRWADSLGDALTKTQSSAAANDGGHGKRHTLGKLKLRAAEDDLPTDWWFASTAIPLISSTLLPLANLLSIAGLVVYWRNDVTDFDEPTLRESTSLGYPDPQWCYNLNVASLVCGFLSNIFLLFNFTKRVRYIVALPATIILCYVASGILIGLTASMAVYVPPGQNQVWSQGYFHAIIASVLYMFNAMILMVNMLGYFLGHYPQHFNLTDEQRNLILQTMMFFIWLGGGAGVFAQIEGWGYPDALYFCDVTVLTIGFGDFYATDDLGRGIVFPYSVGGTIILGLMVSSIHKFAGELSKDKVLRKHIEAKRVHTINRVVTVSDEDERREKLEKEFADLHGQRPSISSPVPNPEIQAHLDEMAKKESEGRDEEEPSASQFLNSSFRGGWTRNTLRLITTPVTAPINSIRKRRSRRQKALVMREEKDRFDAMRKIQSGANKFKKWYALGLSVTAFGILWCIGAIVFWQCEKETQGMTYFMALYFAYVSLLTIGYGDLSPKSNAGKPFFVVWSLIAVPLMTILISDMGDTVIASFKRGTFKLADWTVLPKEGIWRNFIESHPILYNWITKRIERKQRKTGLSFGPDEKQRNDLVTPTIDQLANENLGEAAMARRLAFAIRRTADDLCHHPGKKYCYEDFAEFTRLIRFTQMNTDDLQHDEDEDGVVEWDWLDENSPMLSDRSESEWILDRLCESLLRLLKRSNLGDEPEAPAPWRGVTFNDEYDGTDTANMPSQSSQPSPQQERRQRATGADAVLTFFTGQRRGAHAYGQENLWSSRAREKTKQERRRSSAKERRGPFRLLHHNKPTGALGGGRGGAGVRTLKARKLVGSTR
jgi:potassium channel subfamily K, other eukaryote